MLLLLSFEHSLVFKNEPVVIGLFESKLNLTTKAEQFLTAY